MADAPAPSPDLDAQLAMLADLSLRGAQVATRLMELEQATVEALATSLPNTANPAASLADAIAAGQDVDSITAALAGATPRVEIMARALDRLSRSARRTIALRRRLQTGWPRASASDTRAAMQRRQVATGVGEAIRREADGEAAENLFAELAERLDDLGLNAELLAFPVEQVVARISREIGLATASLAPFQHPNDTPTPSAHPPDTG